MPPGLKVVNTNDVGVSGSGTTGVVGAGVPGDTSGPGGPGIGVSGSGSIGVIGQGDATGVLGGGGAGPGVFGTGKSVGVSGLGDTGVAGAGTTAGVHGSSAATGVVGIGTNGTGVHGAGGHFGVIGESTSTGVGVIGVAGPTSGNTTSIGVVADADTNGATVGVLGICSNGWAVLSQGDCLVQGNFVATDFKSGVVDIGKGDHRALYCMESPECWFEDFGRARLVRGAARVRLERTFARVVRTGDYHVFLSPEGLSHGLYVSRRSRNGFEVREQHHGKSTVPFSYRIVARRKDLDGPRFKRVKLPGPLTLRRPAKPKPVKPVTLPKISEISKSVRPPKLTTPKFPDASRLARRRQGAARLKRRGVSKPVQRRPGSRRSRAR